MKIGILTSSRADYGIYTPLLNLLARDNRFQLELIVFGMHLLGKYGNTIDQILADDFGRVYKVLGMPTSDNPRDITLGYGELIKNFANFYHTHQFDLVIALGDRFEMSAAVQAGIPMEVKFAHLFAGETTLGAIDEIFRHQITLASSLHFVSTEIFAKRVANILNKNENIFNVGALGLDGIPRLKPWAEVRNKYNIPEKPYILITVHPETVGAEANAGYANQLFRALLELAKDNHLIITATNADVNGDVFQQRFEELRKIREKQVTLIKNFGRYNYFSAMKNALLLLGNTSSGIIEAASFGKYVVNLGDRQKGRPQNDNIVNARFTKESILDAIERTKSKGDYTGGNIYFKPDSAASILKILLNARL
jgi:GDP/UDP-N,N'-diacetylbacillosamine 2-epimerase (hydrolysing)